MIATKFTFRTKDGKFPCGAPGMIEWTSDREKAIAMGRSMGGAELVEMDDKGTILAVFPLPNATEHRQGARQGGSNE